MPRSIISTSILYLFLKIPLTNNLMKMKKRNKDWKDV